MKKTKQQQIKDSTVAESLEEDQNESQENSVESTESTESAETPEIPKRKSVPPIEDAGKVNSFGLYESVDYKFRPNGRVDWRKMINPEHIAPNRERTKETDITKLEDKDLVIKLYGFRELADLRRYTQVAHKVVEANPDYVCVETTIVWEPNYETGYKEVVTMAVADAHALNTDGFTRNFLASIAENRGFVRCVRGFLQIPIVGQDEIGANQKSEDNSNKDSNSGSAATPAQTLTNLLEANSISFNALKNRMIKEKITGAEDWENVGSIPSSVILEVLTKLQEILAKKAEKNKN